MAQTTAENRTALSAIIERLYACSEPDRKIDDAIHELMPKPKVVEPLKYTRSIDAALTLIPEGWQAILYTETGGAELYDTRPNPRGGIKARGENRKWPAAGVCIAALKVWAAEAVRSEKFSPQ